MDVGNKSDDVVSHPAEINREITDRVLRIVSRTLSTIHRTRKWRQAPLKPEANGKNVEDNEPKVGGDTTNTTRLTDRDLMMIADRLAVPKEEVVSLLRQGRPVFSIVINACEAILAEGTIGEAEKSLIESLIQVHRVLLRTPARE